MTEQSPIILVVDDQAKNLQILTTTLQAAGYRVSSATNGPAALRLCEKRSFDLILCDIMMPEMDGYAVCRQLKANPETRDIPLIFLTAKTQNEDVLQGFEAGAVDYVTKPFNTSELLARVKTHTELKRAHDTIVNYSRQLENLNQEKNNFLGIAAHDLKNPLTTIMLSAEMVSIKKNKIEPEELGHYTDIIYKDAERMLMIISNLLDVNRIESRKLSLQPECLDPQAFTQKLLRQYQTVAQSKQIEIRTVFAPELPEWVTDPHIAYQIADNLLSNAIKYSPPGKEVEICWLATERALALQVRDQGPGLTEEDHSKLFQKFARLSAKPTAGENSTGLGLSIVKMLCEILHSQIHCESEPGQGACFQVEFSPDLRAQLRE